MYKAYLAGLSGQQLQFMGLSLAEAAAFALGVLDKVCDCRHPRCRGRLEEDVTQLIDGEWTPARDAMQERLNQMQTERDELRSRCDEMVAEVQQQIEDFGELRIERDHLLAELVAARRESFDKDTPCDGKDSCPLCYMARV